MFLFFIFAAAALIAPVIWPGIDLWASGLFYRAGQGFFLADQPLFVALHWLAYVGPRVLGIGFAVLAFAAWRRHAPVFLNAKAWLFLLLALIIGPGLIANAGFKDHWGRARPNQIVDFGGDAAFSPALEPQPDPRRNGSFVCGDGAFGFFFPAFALVVPPNRSRRTFWCGIGVGGLFSFIRLAMGGHFLSDIFYAAFFMLASSSALYAAMYGRRAMAARWRGWFTNGSCG